MSNRGTDSHPSPEHLLPEFGGPANALLQACRHEDVDANFHGLELVARVARVGSPENIASPDCYVICADDRHIITVDE